MKRSIMTGSIAALLSMFPVASLLALVWKFPLPMGGYAQGVRAALLAPLAALFYGLFGGFLVVPALGAASGALAFKLSEGDSGQARKLSIALGVASAVAAGVFLNVLDKIIGPW
ncbi:MAG: hypothetical protein V4617_03125 [Gemmatimonadota bacterium]